MSASRTAAWLSCVVLIKYIRAGDVRGTKEGALSQTTDDGTSDITGTYNCNLHGDILYYVINRPQM